jgi:hypothetical protein
VKPHETLIGKSYRRDDSVSHSVEPSRARQTGTMSDLLDQATPAQPLTPSALVSWAEVSFTLLVLSAHLPLPENSRWKGVLKVGSDIFACRPGRA